MPFGRGNLKICRRGKDGAILLVALATAEERQVGAHAEAAVEGDTEHGSLMAGQSVGMMNRVQPLREILAKACEEFVTGKSQARDLAEQQRAGAELEGAQAAYAEGDPVVEDSETIAGQRMGYNFRHKTGAVEDGVTAFDQYYYVGDEIRRFEDTTLKICGGRMTSCDLEQPHYHFWSDKMKMRMEDKVVAAPIVMRVGRVPVFALPFYYKSLKQGRQSGILFPSFDFGWSSRDGRYIRDFGYYWATNDYLDFLIEGDFNENQDVLNALSIGGVAPTAESAEDNSYPLSRPLFIYSDAGVMNEKPAVAGYINFFLTYVNDEVIDGPRELKMGDCLTVGLLDFVVIIDRSGQCHPRSV